MLCPKCSTEVIKSHSGFNHTGAEYWYCRKCKDEVEHPVPDTKERLTQAEIDELLSLTLLGFTTEEAEQVVKYARNNGMSLRRALNAIPNPHSVWGQMAPQEWHDYENKRATAVRALESAAPSAPSLPIGQKNTLYSWP